MFWALSAWGVLASLQGVITNIPLLVIDRFLLGMVEGVVLPGMLVFLTHWFTKRERSKVKNYWNSFRMPRVMLLSAQYFFWSIGVYGFVLWLPSMIQAGSKPGLGITGLLSAVPYLLAIILMLVASYFSDRTMERKLFV